MLILAALVSAIGDVATQYASAALLGGHGLPGATGRRGLVERWLGTAHVPALPHRAAVPDRALLSPRWRVIVWVAVASMGTLFVLSHLDALDDPFSKIDNPLEVDAGPIVSTVVSAAVVLGILGSLAAAFACAVVRFRRATGDEREQLKWFFLAAAALPMGLAIHLVAETFFVSAVDEVERGTGSRSCCIAIAIGIAILKYRLYEIDRIISRTLVYGGLTVVLGAVYIGLVLAGQALFSSFAGGSNLAIAASTLAVAALFLPARSRVQRFVDRRFYRRRYDAQRTLEAFGTRLREQVDLETLDGELRGVVRRRCSLPTSRSGYGQERGDEVSRSEDRARRRPGDRGAGEPAIERRERRLEHAREREVLRVVRLRPAELVRDRPGFAAESGVAASLGHDPDSRALDPSCWQPLPGNRPRTDRDVKRRPGLRPEQGRRDQILPLELREASARRGSDDDVASTTSCVNCCPESP